MSSGSHDTKQLYALQRISVKSGFLGRVYQNTLVGSDGEALFKGVTKNGYITKKGVVFTDQQTGEQLTYSANRLIAPSHYILKKADNQVIAVVKTGSIQISIGGKSFAVLDATGNEICRMKPAELTESKTGYRIDAWMRDDLVVLQDKRIVATTFSKKLSDEFNTRQKQKKNKVLQLVKAPFILIATLIKMIFESIFQKEKRTRAERTIARLYPSSSKQVQITPQVALSILLFKAYYHDLRSRG